MENRANLESLFDNLCLAYDKSSRMKIINDQLVAMYDDIAQCEKKVADQPSAIDDKHNKARRAVFRYLVAFFKAFQAESSEGAARYGEEARKSFDILLHDDRLEEYRCFAHFGIGLLDLFNLKRFRCTDLRLSVKDIDHRQSALFANATNNIRMSLGIEPGTELKALAKKARPFAYGWYMLGSCYHNNANRQRTLTREQIEQFYRDAEFCYRKALRVLEQTGGKRLKTNGYGMKVQFPSLYNDLGNALIRQPSASAAEVEKCYRIAISQAKICGDKFAYPYNGLGSLYRKSGDYKKAIEYYNLARECDPGFSHPYNYLGDCYLELGHFKEALRFYEQSYNLEPGNIFPINGIGRVCYELGKRFNPDKYYILADVFFRYVSSKDPMFYYSHLYHGRMLTRMGEYVAANEAYKRALARCSDARDRLYQIRVSQRENQELKELKKPGKIKNRSSSEIADELVKQTVARGLDADIFTNEKQFQDFLAEKQGILERNPEFSLEVMRRWNSYTPLVADSKGGGYFLNSGGYGMVIDPGFSFIDNFKNAGHKFNEIDAVLISHAHDDHTADYESILTLVHKYRDLVNKDYIPARLAKKYSYSKKLVKNIINDNFEQEDVELVMNDLGDWEDFVSRINRENEELKTDPQNYLNLAVIIPMSVEAKYRYMTINSVEKFAAIHLVHSADPKAIAAAQDIGQIYEHANDRFHKIIQMHQVYDKNVRTEICLSNPGGEPVRVMPLKARHKEIVSEDLNTRSDAKYHVPLGFLINQPAQETSIIYTGDSGWWLDDKETLESQYNEITRHCLEQRVLLAHLGGFHENELKTGSNTRKDYYSNHLGRRGLVNVCQVVKPQICIVSEFGEEFRSLRVALVNILKKMRELNETFFIPADLNLKLLITRKEIYIRAVSNIDRRFRWVEYDYVPFKNIDFIEIQKNDSIEYYTTRGRFSGSDVVEALSNDYTPIYNNTIDESTSYDHEITYFDLLGLTNRFLDNLPRIDPKYCIGCGNCIEESECRALVESDSQATLCPILDPAACTRCGACEKYCKQNAIWFFKKDEMTPSRYRRLFDHRISLDKASGSKKPRAEHLLARN